MACRSRCSSSDVILTTQRCCAWRRLMKRPPGGTGSTHRSEIARCCHDRLLVSLRAIARNDPLDLVDVPVEQCWSRQHARQVIAISDQALVLAQWHLRHVAQVKSLQLQIDLLATRRVG